MSTRSLFKRVQHSFMARKLMEGDGATVYRSVGSHIMQNLDPFLLLDDADTREGAFPDHPHRGFEIIVYMLKGRVRHEDSQGGKGVITEGGGQWMTVGKGIIHAEKMDSPHVHAVVVWVNLKKAMKFAEPGYQQFTKETIKKAHDPQSGVSATILAGTALGQTAETFTRTPASFIDFDMQQGSTLTHPMTPGWNSLLYMLEGKLALGGSVFAPKNAVVLTTAESMLQVRAESKSRFILISGEPTNEPIVQHGPFVMNTKEEIRAAFEDYYNAKNGFEGASTWKSQLFYS